MIFRENGSKKPARFFYVLLCLVLTAAGFCASAEGTSKLSRAEGARLGKKVKGIFEKKCARCHTPDGSDREKYKNEVDIDFILNLKKLASNLDIISPGDPRGSGLYPQVEDSSMPYSDTGENHLPKEEKSIIEKWIKAGAPDEKGDLVPAAP
ncbi:MAG: hypothetical protein VCE91_17300 [Nitrospinota bacterium]